MATDSDDIAKLVAAVSAEYAADVYFYSGSIEDAGFGQIAAAIAKGKKLDKALLILVTNGGSANSAYQIARLFQKSYEQFIVFTPSYCKSAGTLIVLGAHRLIMDAISELGPLDVQLMKQNEIIARKSGLLSRSSFESLAEVAFELYEQFMLKITMASDGQVSFKLASELSANMASNLLSPVYGQLNPDIIGSDYRDLNVAVQYGYRLVHASQNADMNTVQHLVNHYPSHDFIIDNEEASGLFLNVDTPSEALYDLLASLGPAAYSEADNLTVQPLTLREETPAQEQENDHARGKGGTSKPDGRKVPVDENRGHDRESDSAAPSKAGAAGAPDGRTKRRGSTPRRPRNGPKEPPTSKKAGTRAKLN